MEQPEEISRAARVRKIQRGRANKGPDSSVLPTEDVFFAGSGTDASLRVFADASQHVILTIHGAILSRFRRLFDTQPAPGVHRIVSVSSLWTVCLQPLLPAVLRPGQLRWQRPDVWNANRNGRLLQAAAQLWRTAIQSGIRATVAIRAAVAAIGIRAAAGECDERWGRRRRGSAQILIMATMSPVTCTSKPLDKHVIQLATSRYFRLRGSNYRLRAFASWIPSWMVLSRTRFGPVDGGAQWCPRLAPRAPCAAAETCRPTPNVHDGALWP
jgi:hypothetical protein